MEIKEKLSKAKKIPSMVVSPFKAFFVYLKEVFFQIRKVKWPGFFEAAKDTAIVIVLSFVVAVFLGGIDFGFTTFLNKVILPLSKTI